MKRKPKDIEKQLIQAIQESGMSLNKLAITSGVNVAMLSRLMSGERSITLPTAAKLAKALGLELHKVEDDNNVA